MSALCLLLSLWACGGPEPVSLDLDGDGAVGVNDCDETNAQINAWATELCNGVDDNCDEAVDEGLTQEFWRDIDGDGFGDPFKRELLCEISDGFAANNSDCDDTNPEINPNGTEIPNNGVDEDCSGEDLLTP